MEGNKNEASELETKTVEPVIISESPPESPVISKADEKQEGQAQHTTKDVSDQFKILQEIRALIQDRLSYDAAKEKAIDKLSDEVKFYRDNFLFQSQKPIFINLIMLYDSLERIVNSFSAEKDLSREQVLTLSNNLGNLKEELLEILYRSDIVPFEEHHEFLDYKLHKTVKTVPTSVENENNMIDKVIKIGFRYNDKVLRPEEVIIKKFVKA